MPKRESGAVDGVAECLCGERQDVVVKRPVAAAADVVIAADDEKRQIAKPLGACGLRIPEHLQVRLVVRAVALNEIAHLEEERRVIASRPGGGGLASVQRRDIRVLQRGFSDFVCSLMTFLFTNSNFTKWVKLKFLDLPSYLHKPLCLAGAGASLRDRLRQPPSKLRFSLGVSVFRYQCAGKIQLLNLG